MDIQKIRQDFPFFANKNVDKNGKEVPVYFDSACMTLKPKSVIDAEVDYYENYSSCGERSLHHLGEAITRKVDEARHQIAKFIGAKKDEIIFVKNTTEAINLVAHSFDFKVGDIIFTSDKEHNSNLIPWQIVAKKSGASHEVIPSKNDNTFDLEKFEQMMSEKVKMVALGLTSNLDGVTIPAKEIIKIVHKFGAKVLLDAAQAVPHQKINVKDLDVDFLAFSGHKMLGPTGTGVLYGKKELLEDLDPFIVGGGTVDFSDYQTHRFLPVPEKFEGGLQNYAGIIGFGEAVKYLENVGWENITKAEKEINKFITDELQKIEGVQIIGPENSDLRGSIISFNIGNTDPHQITIMLDKSAGIMTRSGNFCVHSWFGAHNIDGAVRVSFYFYNTMEEAKIFVENIKKIIQIL